MKEIKITIVLGILSLIVLFSSCAFLYFCPDSAYSGDVKKIEETAEEVLIDDLTSGV